MQTFTKAEHQIALLRRRIRAVVKYPAMARLFRGGTHDMLESALLRKLNPSTLAAIQTQDEYDRWLEATVEDDCWAAFSRIGIDQDRWAYFAKLINIIVYEIVANRELFAETDWNRLRAHLHVPIDSVVTYHLQQVDPAFPARYRLKDMTKADYWQIQKAVRQLAREHDVPPIWFEAAWSA